MLQRPDAVFLQMILHIDCEEDISVGLCVAGIGPVLLDRQPETAAVVHFDGRRLVLADGPHIVLSFSRDIGIAFPGVPDQLVAGRHFSGALFHFELCSDQQISHFDPVFRRDLGDRSIEGSLESRRQLLLI